MALPDGTAQLQVRWPGGVTNVIEVPAGAREVVVDVNGKVTEIPRR